MKVSLFPTYQERGLLTPKSKIHSKLRVGGKYEDTNIHGTIHHLPCSTTAISGKEFGYFCSLDPHLKKPIKMFTYDDQTLHGVSTIHVLRVHTCHMIHK